MLALDCSKMRPGHDRTHDEPRYHPDVHADQRAGGDGAPRIWLIVGVIVAVGMVIVATSLGVVLSRAGCDSGLTGSAAAYCAESDVVGKGVGVTIGFLVPPAVTMLAVGLCIWRRHYTPLWIVAVAMVPVAFLFPLVV